MLRWLAVVSQVQHKQGKGSYFEPAVFDACIHLCRTSSRSIRGGNEYKSALKHCYSDKDTLTKKFDSKNTKVVVARYTCVFLLFVTS